MAQLLDTEINGNLNVSGQLQIGNTNIDYIVEQGTSGIWTYRKWNSGIAECWGMEENITVNVTTAWGSNLYYGYIYGRDFPTDLFKETPCALIDVLNDGCWLCKKPCSKSETNTIYIISVNPSSSKVCTFQYNIKGKWK